MPLTAKASCLMVIDVQDRLAPAIPEAEAITRTILRLLRAAARLDVPVLASAQYPDGLGPMVEPLQAALPDDAVIEKTAFACLREPGFAARFNALGRRQAVLTGMEAHVCVLQTAMSFLEAGVETYLVVDAVGSRHRIDFDIAVRRLARLGVELVTSEMVLFEWLERAATPTFRDVLPLIKERDGDAP